MKTSDKPWDGRFSEKTDRRVEAFTSSIEIDKRLYAYDIEGSIAHCRTLAKAEVISEDEASTLIQGLGQIRREIDHGDFRFDDSLEDIHMHIENRLLQISGKSAQKLHTARSRNDQVALDVRMYLRHETREVIDRLQQLRSVLVDSAYRHIDVVMPGYTHLQHAQPVLFAHHLMAYYEMFKRDGQRFEDALRRIDVMPLGCAALAGTTYPIDRHYTAQLLDFAAVSENSLDGVSDRDFVMEFISAAAVCMVHLSRLSEEMVLWSSTEFGFVILPDAFATGSSIMPQKKNPDVPELVRGKTGSVLGDWVAVMTMMKALPLAYNRDMQEDKPALFRSVDVLQACLDIYIRMLPHLAVDRSKMSTAADKGYLNATDMADYLVGKGMPFREAHACVGKAVAYALKQHKELHQLSLDELKPFSGLIDKDLLDCLDTRRMVERRSSYGGTAPSMVVEAIDNAKKALAAEAAARKTSTA